MQTDTYKLPPVKRQALIRKGLGRWLTVIDFLLQRFAGIERIMERHEEDDPMVVMVTIINEVSTMTDAQATEAHLRQSLAHLPLFHYRAMHPGEPWDPIEGSLEEFKARDAILLGRSETLPGAWYRRALARSAVRSGAQL
jgi:hypothetical protein